MPKTIQSPVKRWPGSIILADPLNWPQIITWRNADSAAKKYFEMKDDSGKADLTDPLGYHQELVIGVLACVEKWELGNGFPEKPTLETFPSTPLKTAVRLVQAVSTAIAEVITENDDLPNE